MATCPVTGQKAGVAGSPHDVPHKNSPMTASPAGPYSDYGDVDDISLTPSQQEYRKLKRVMKIMVKFYSDGSQAKLDQYEILTREIRKMETDEKMVAAQQAAVKDFPEHPKKTSWEKRWEMELATIGKQKVQFQAKADEFKGLYEWSLGVCECVSWLEKQLDEYCATHLEGLDITFAPADKLSKDEYFKFRKALEEITFNLEESQDFFHATLDGRIKEFQSQEKAMIEAQLKALEEFPPMSERRALVEEELQADLKHLEDHMEETPSTLKRRQTMLTSHKDFFKVLKWNREKMRKLVDGLTDEEADRLDKLAVESMDLGEKRSTIFSSIAKKP